MIAVHFTLTSSGAKFVFLFQQQSLKKKTMDTYCVSSGWLLHMQVMPGHECSLSTIVFYAWILQVETEADGLHKYIIELFQRNYIIRIFSAF